LEVKNGLNGLNSLKALNGLNCLKLFTGGTLTGLENASDSAETKLPSLIRREFKLKAKTPTWLGLPAMMRMTMTSPNVMRHNRPDWLAPFNFFLFPMISAVGGYPPGIEKSDFNFIVPFESDRSKWKTLKASI
jgi:hypothetical protein